VGDVDQVKHYRTTIIIPNQQRIPENNVWFVSLYNLEACFIRSKC
jgi:hypothetical protein